MRFFLSILIISTIVSLPLDASALSLNPLGGAFGGKILTVIPCTCSFSLMIIVGPPVGGTFIYIPGVSTLYKWYILRPGVWSLGTAAGKATCLQVSGVTGCIPTGFGSVIRKIGTSN